MTRSHALARRAPIALLLAFAVSSARADEFSDFRIPKHSLRSGAFDLSGTANRFRDSGTQLGDASWSDEYSSSAIAGLDVSWLLDSDPKLMSLRALVRGGGGRSGSKGENATSSPLGVFRGNGSGANWRTNEEAFLSFDGREYPWPIAVGFTAHSRAEGIWLNDWESTNRSESIASPFSYEEQRSGDARSNQQTVYSLEGGVGFGVGRVRDATGVYRARILEHRLEARGVLAHALSAAAASRLAQLFYVESDYKIHDRGAKYFWGQVEAILRDDGALARSGLDASTALRLLEPEGVPASLKNTTQAIPRPVGWYVGVRLDGGHVHSTMQREMHQVTVVVQDTLPPQRTDVFDREKFDGEHDIIYVGPAFELHRPIGLRWQLDGSMLAQSALPNQQFDHALRVSTTASLSWLISDRWLWQSSIRQLRSYVTPPSRPLGREDRWSVGYGTGVRYFFEDFLSADLSVDELQVSRRTPEVSGFTRSGQIQLGLTYHVFGAHEAQGLIAPDRLGSTW